jgi:hypothetical protein
LYAALARDDICRVKGVGSAAGECAAQYKALVMHDHLLEPDAELVRTAVAEHKPVQLSVVGDALSWLRLRDPGACICQCTCRSWLCSLGSGSATSLVSAIQPNQRCR